MIRKLKNGNTVAVRLANLESTFGNKSLGAQKVKGLDTPCHVHVHNRRYRLTDPGGISYKAAIDGIVYAGLLPDDSLKEISEITESQEKIKAPEIEETIITIT